MVVSEMGWTPAIPVAATCSFLLTRTCSIAVRHNQSKEQDSKAGNRSGEVWWRTAPMPMSRCVDVCIDLKLSNSRAFRKLHGTKQKKALHHPRTPTAVCWPRCVRGSSAARQSDCRMPQVPVGCPKPCKEGRGRGRSAHSQPPTAAAAAAPTASPIITMRNCHL